MKTLATAFLVVAMTGCQSTGFPLVFGQAQTVGISIGGSTPEQKAELTLGYKDANIAVIPTKELSTASDGNGHPFSDSLSVLGQFEVNTAAGAAPKASLGKFFATGLAARTLADGFRCELSADAPHKSCR